MLSRGIHRAVSGHGTQTLPRALFGSTPVAADLYGMAASMREPFSGKNNGAVVHCRAKARELSADPGCTIACTIA